MLCLRPPAALASAPPSRPSAPRVNQFTMQQGGRKAKPAGPTPRCRVGAPQLARKPPSNVTPPCRVAARHVQRTQATMSLSRRLRCTLQQQQHSTKHAPRQTQDATCAAKPGAASTSAAHQTAPHLHFQVEGQRLLSCAHRGAVVRKGCVRCIGTPGSGGAGSQGRVGGRWCRCSLLGCSQNPTNILKACCAGELARFGSCKLFGMKGGLAQPTPGCLAWVHKILQLRAGRGSIGEGARRATLPRKGTRQRVGRAASAHSRCVAEHAGRCR